MRLLIVESPNKIKKIKALLGSDWDVGFSLQRGENPLYLTRLFEQNTGRDPAICQW